MDGGRGGGGGVHALCTAADSRGGGGEGEGGLSSTYGLTRHVNTLSRPTVKNRISRRFHEMVDG